MGRGGSAITYTHTHTHTFINCNLDIQALSLAHTCNVTFDPHKEKQGQRSHYMYARGREPGNRGYTIKLCTHPNGSLRVKHKLLFGRALLIGIVEP